jgi:hypothetical protein
MHMLLLVIEPLFLTLHEASLICSFQAPQYDYFNNFNVILMETYVSRKIKYIMHNVQSHDQRYMGPFGLLKMSTCFTVLKHVVLSYDKISITCVFPLTEHTTILFNDLSSLHFM